MKNLKTLIGFTALIAVILFTMSACIINVPDDKEDTPNYSIEGTWAQGSHLISISGTTGVITRLPNDASGYTQSAIDKGYLRVGTTVFRYISKTGDRTWTGQDLLINHSGNTATGTTWSQTGTFTLDSNGKSFVFSCTASSGPYTYTYTRN
jgi:hypothetical protein